MILSGYRKRKRNYYTVVSIFTVILLILCVFAMCYGNTVYSLRTVFDVLRGEEAEGAGFTIYTLRLPRMLAGVFCGMAFAMAGNTFQRLLGNPLASPDIIGVTAGSSMAAVFGILFLNLSRDIVSMMAVASGLGVACIIYFLAISGGYSNGRLILIGIGMQYFLNSMISWMLLKASEYDVASALRWLGGSLNGVQLADMPRLVFIVVVFGAALFLLQEHLNVLQLGNAHAITMGVDVTITRVALIVCSMMLIAFATAVSGPIASVAFLSGPIAANLAGKGESNLLSSALVGAILVMASDLVGQYALPAGYPVGVITGILGAPYLIFLLIGYNKRGA